MRPKFIRAGYLVTALLSAQLVLTSACGPAETSDQGSGLAVLAQAADSYAQAQPGQALLFPRDHGAHPDYRIEWWYLTANLHDAMGASYGAQWTLFRLAIRADGSAVPNSSGPAKNSENNQVFMAHVAMTTPTGHLSFQRYARGGDADEISRAGVTAEPFSAWLDDWELRSTGEEWLPLEVKARQADNAMHLQLRGTAPLVLQGEAGFSAKHADGGGSFYYSQPFLKVSGQLTIAGQVIPVNGDAWLDREWSSQFLQPEQSGWDWFSLHLESGEKLMLFQVRGKPGQEGAANYLQGNLMAPDGSTTRLDPDLIQLVPVQKTRVAGRDLPLHWRVLLPQVDRQFEIQATIEDQWMAVDFPYWEGAVTVSGSGPGNRGKGYMELTGYPLD
jgi:predicted secreted hydrolase